MKKEFISEKVGSKKSGLGGDKIWRTHRLEGVVKKVGIKPIRKKKRVNIKTEKIYLK